MLKLTHKIALLIIIPLAIEFIFLRSLIGVLDQTEVDRDRERQAIDSLVYINLVLNEASNEADALFQLQATGSADYQEKVKTIASQLLKHAEKLKVIEKSSKKGSAELERANAELEKFISTIVETCDEIDKNAIDIGKEDDTQRQIVNDLTNRLDNLNKQGLAVLQQQSEVRESLAQKVNTAKTNMRTFIEIASIANGIFAIVLTALFTFIFAKRFNTVVGTAMTVAVRKPLGTALQGNDELASLDRFLRTLATELETSRQRERDMIDNTAEVICSLDHGFKIQEINSAVSRRLGYNVRDIVGSHLMSLIHIDDKENIFKQLEKCRDEGVETSVDARLRKADGRYLYTEWAVKYSNLTDTIFCVVRDVTERKEAEKLKEQMVAMISHDLRAPLTSLGLMADIFLEGAAGELNTRGKRLAHNAKHSIQSLMKLINDLIDAERFEAGAVTLKLRSEPVEQVVADAVAMVQNEAQRKNVQIDVSCPAMQFVFDGSRIQRVLVNLMANAIKFSPEDSNISVACCLMPIEDEPDSLHVQVTDHGPGIPTEKAEKIFEKFVQLDPKRDKERGGSGLGLAICKGIVDAHGGEIGVASEPPDGSTFWFRIPGRQVQSEKDDVGEQ